jgi:hypothetical protein
VARDPEVQHPTAELCDGIRRVQGGDDLMSTPPLREELVFIGLLVTDHAGGVHVTREGRQFLESEAKAQSETV